MKLGKDEIQKIVLSSLLFSGLLYGYFAFLLNPMARKQKAAAQQIEELQPLIRAAKGQLKQTAALEQEAPAAMDTLAKIESLIPDGAPVAWFPPRITDFFKRQGIEKTAVRLVREGAPPADIPGFRQLTWIVELRDVEFVPLGIALAGLENQEPLLRIDQLRIEASRTNFEEQVVTLSVSNLVKK